MLNDCCLEQRAVATVQLPLGLITELSVRGHELGLDREVRHVNSKAGQEKPYEEIDRCHAPGGVGPKLTGGELAEGSPSSLWTQ